MKNKQEGKNIKNVPNLRFPGFEGEWTERKIQDLGSFIGGGTPDTSDQNFWNGTIPWISSSDITIGDIHNILKTRFITEQAIKVSATKLIPKGAILMVSRVGIGKFAIANEELCTSQDFTNLITNENEYFLCYYFNAHSNDFVKISQGTSIKGFTIQDIKSAVFFIPSIKEQKKISSFLTVLDDKITTQSKIIKQLETSMRNFRERLFSRKIRFKNYSGLPLSDWNTIKLGDIATRITTKNKENNKNVLTISAQYGLINQLDFFNKSVSAKDLTGYFLLSRNHFAYNKSYSNGYPMGAIKRLKHYDKGVVSTLYICFDFNAGISFDFMEHYFEAGIQNPELEKIAQEGARNHGLLNIGLTDFFNIEITVPSVEEQNNIGKFLCKFQERIEVEKQLLLKYENQKKYLLKNLFI